MDQERARLIELIRTLPDDKIRTIMDFINRLMAEYAPVVDEEDELLMK